MSRVGPVLDTSNEVAQTELPFRLASRSNLLLRNGRSNSSHTRVVTIYASVTAGVTGGIDTLQHGDCFLTKKLSMWLHVAINMLSTMLLGASNYCMQYSSSPTREEVDEAHLKGSWLGIAVPSVRNLRHISWRRVTLWWLLGLGSLPSHLMSIHASYTPFLAKHARLCQRH